MHEEVVQDETFAFGVWQGAQPEEYLVATGPGLGSFHTDGLAQAFAQLLDQIFDVSEVNEESARKLHVGHILSHLIEHFELPTGEDDDDQEID